MTQRRLARFVVLIMAAVIVTMSPAPLLAQSDDQPVDETKKKQDRPDIYDETADAQTQIDAALAKARKENRRVLIQWGANWCGWCHLLHDAFEHDRMLHRKLQYEYDIVLVDIGRWDKHMDLAKELGADVRSHGVPFLTILDADGKPIINQETASFEIKKDDGSSGHDASKLTKFFAKHQASYRAAETILQDGLAEAKASDRNVLVHFGAPWCGWCHLLEDWMAQDDVAKLVAEDWVDVKIDIDRTIGGKDMLNAFRRSTRGGIPWFVFLDADGEVIVTSDGPNGNVGCPYTPEELSAFRDILLKATKRLTTDDVDEIVASLETFHTNRSKK